MAYVYLVKQNQPACAYLDKTIGVYSDEKDAIAVAREYNREYGENCQFDDNWDYVEWSASGDPHYYTVEKMKVREERAVVDSEKIDKFLDSVIEKIEEKYNEGEFEEGYQEAIDYFENEVIDYCDDEYPDLKCQVMEWEDDDYLDVQETIRTVCSLCREYRVVDFFEKNWNDSNFLVLLTERI